METNNFIYLLIGAFALVVIGIYFGTDLVFQDPIVGHLEMHKITVSGEPETLVMFNGVSAGYVNNEGILNKNLPSGTYTVECVGYGSQTVNVKTDISIEC